MNIEIVRSRQRYQISGDENSSYTFSFGSYFNPRLMGFGILKTFNIRTLNPGAQTYYRNKSNTEILTLMLKGSLHHEDDAHKETDLPAGSIQNLSTGRGIQFRDSILSDLSPAVFLEIWLLPSERFTLPAYGQKPMAPGEHPNQLVPIASREGGEFAVKINQDATIYRCLLEENQKLEYHPGAKEGRGLFFFLISGMVFVGGQTLHPQDSAMITQAESLQIASYKEADFLLLDIPMKNW